MIFNPDKGHGLGIFKKGSVKNGISDIKVKEVIITFTDLRTVIRIYMVACICEVAGVS